VRARARASERASERQTERERQRENTLNPKSEKERVRARERTSLYLSFIVPLSHHIHTTHTHLTRSPTCCTRHQGVRDASYRRYFSVIHRYICIYSYTNIYNALSVLQMDRSQDSFSMYAHGHAYTGTTNCQRGHFFLANFANTHSHWLTRKLTLSHSHITKFTFANIYVLD
jgi:hypothetical protein